MFFANSLFAQNSISGQVLSEEDNLTLPGVNISVKDSTNGTTSDLDGNFKLDNVSPNDVLVFSYVGYDDLEIQVGTQSFIKAMLKQDSYNLDELVLVGYGTQTKKEVTGAVSVIGEEEITKLNATRIDQVLQGSATGVNVTSGSGSPGSGFNIRIRGISTNGDARPLILVDGNRIEDLSVINPNDIESMNVIKDATAGIYGFLQQMG